MKRTSLLSILALVAAALLPLAAFSQVYSSTTKGSNGESGDFGKYEIYAGYGYTTLNQVNQARHGLEGVELSVTRDFSKHFGFIADGAAYVHPLSSPEVENSPVRPTVDMVLFGPVFQAKVYRNASIFARALIGGEHTGGTNQSPNISFAGGLGIGLDYHLTHHLFVRLGADDIESSFTAVDYTESGTIKGPGYSPLRTRSSRGTFGIAYKF